MSDVSEEFERQKAALERVRASVEDHSLSTDNDLVASNTVAWELGAFRDKRPPIDDEIRDGLLVRARSDALASKLNSAHALDRIEEISSSIKRVHADLAATKTLLTILACILVGIIAYLAVAFRG
ncbi:hypothetical protein JVX98_13180 [Ensifer sp. PDNC004]|uniref:hypothetical protein n=1 Tax=Ensifer sp. PDNC004 TaxID=2811423 RepID=UPI00196356AC|nr:hypothetical protein [Ensifer sp. PDNC004]QRY69168.1 hypothetical protein JVX98_13180 [Ensifer sp. PDNC004]